MQIHRDGLRPVPVKAERAGRAFEVLYAAFPHKEREIRQAFARKDVVDRCGVPISIDAHVVKDDLICVFRPITDEPEIPITPTIIAENERWIAMDKPPSMATMPRGAHVAGSATIVVRRFLHNPEVVAAHRLDAATRGVLLLIKKKEYRGSYQKMFQQGEVTKRYLAVACARDEFIDECQVSLRLNKPRNSLQTLVEEGEENSATRIRLLQRRGQRGLYEVTPLTGKTHQIRAVFSHLGMPIEGDWLYPEVGQRDTGRLQLLAHTLSFTDPVSGEKVRLRSGQHLDF